MALDQQVKWVSVPGFRARDQRCIFLCNQMIGGGTRRIRSANRVHEFYWHRASPSLLAFKLISVYRLFGLTELNGNPQSLLHFGLATRLELTSELEMNRDFHFDSHRGPIKQRWLILPLQHGLQCRGYQQRVAAQSTRSHHVSALIDHRVDYHGARDMRLPREYRIFGLNRKGLPWCFEVGANANNSFRCGLLRRGDCYGSPRAT